MQKLSSLRKLRGDEVEEIEPRKVTLRLAPDVAEALALGKARGHGSMSAQVEELVRARESARTQK